MFTLLILFDVTALAILLGVARRRAWQGLRGELMGVTLVTAVALAVTWVITTPLGNFAVMRGACHALFCVSLPYAALRAWQVRRTAPRWFVLVLALVISAEGCYLWARRIEPFRLEVTTHRIHTPRLQQLTKPVRVAIVADLQTEAITDYEVGVFDRILEAAPDLVLFLGDYLQIPLADYPQRLPALHAQLARLQPRLGMFAVDGDVDEAGAAAIFDSTSVRVLVDGQASLPDLPIDIIGLSRMRSRAPFLDVGVVRRLSGERYCIVMGHAPDFMLSVVRDGLSADALFVAGHTHGGQVQIPGFGPILWLSAVPRWLGAGGVFQQGRTWLCCSRGIGMERFDAPRVRFWCRPQLVFLELGGTK